jgi:predicted ATP-dependent Lon-type protease
MKLIYPDKNIAREQAQEILEHALVGRRRVKEQLKKNRKENISSCLVQTNGDSLLQITFTESLINAFLCIPSTSITSTCFSTNVLYFNQYAL